MCLTLPTLPEWDALSVEECRQVAVELAAQLPAPFCFRAVAQHQCGDQQRWVALFDWHDTPFALVPGGDVQLGYDPANFRPSPGQQRDWRRMRREYSTFPPFHEFLPSILTPVRTVTLQPFLMAVEPIQLGREERHPVGGRSAGHRLHNLTHQAVTQALAQDGFRLPTSDEWEHACAGGSRTLFRWGDDCPVERDPCGEGDPLPPFDIHRRPNAFGLRIAYHPYHGEPCAEAGTMRGGDGGSMRCGGLPFLFSWLSLASSFQASSSPTRLSAPFVRRVWPLRCPAGTCASPTP